MTATPRRFEGAEGQHLRQLGQAIDQNASDLKALSTKQREAIGPYQFIDIPASATSVLKLANITGATKALAVRAGSLVGFGAILSANAAGEALRIEVLVNGTIVSTVYMKSGTAKVTQTWATSIHKLKVEDELEVQVKTTAAWTATTADITAWLEVEG